MDDARLVGLRESIGDRRGDLQRAARRQRTRAAEAARSVWPSTSSMLMSGCDSA